MPTASSCGAPIRIFRRSRMRRQLRSTGSASSRRSSASRPLSGRTAASSSTTKSNPTRFTLDSPASSRALEEFLKLRWLYGVVPSDVEVEAEDDETRFLNGRMAMLLESRRLVPALREAAEFDWDVAALPRHTQPASILHSDAYCMTKASTEKDAAWRFVEYALGPEGAPVIAETGRTVPSLRSVAESDAFLDPSQKPRNAKVFLDAIPAIRKCSDGLHLARDRGCSRADHRERHVPRKARRGGRRRGRRSDAAALRAGRIARAHD